MGGEYAIDEIRKCLVRILEGMPGAEIEDLRVALAQNIVHAQISLRGWGPGLHSYLMKWTPRFEIPIERIIGKGDEGLRAAIMSSESGFTTHVARQERRAAIAASLGIVTPLAVKGGYMAASDPAAMPVEHMLIDRSLLTIVVKAAGQTSDDGKAARHDVLCQLALDAYCAQEGSATHDGRVTSGQNLIRKTQSSMVDGEHAPILRPTHVLKRKPMTFFDGHQVVVRQSIPATVAGFATGRILGEILRTGRDIDDRIIVRIGTSEVSSVFDIESDLVRIGDLPNHPMTFEEVMMMPAA